MKENQISKDQVSLLSLILLAVMAAVVGAAAMFVVVRLDQQQAPHCPQEDSCTIDYRKGHWYINEKKVTR